MDVTDCRDLTSLQTLLMMILFLQSSSRLSTCYSNLGIALRSAIRMGLHRNVQNHFNPVEQEVRKRIFWCVIKLDIYVGALLGLPKMLADEDIDQEYPLEVDDDYITTENILPMPPDKPSLMAAFNAHTRVVELLGKTVKYIYPIKGNRGKTSQSYIVSHARIREIEQDLQKWFESLPMAFRPGMEAPKEFIRYRHECLYPFQQCSDTAQNSASPTHGLRSHRDDGVPPISALCFVRCTSEDSRQTLVCLCISLCKRLAEHRPSYRRDEEKGVVSRIILVLHVYNLLCCHLPCLFCARESRKRNERSNFARCPRRQRYAGGPRQKKSCGGPVLEAADGELHRFHISIWP